MPQELVTVILPCHNEAAAIAPVLYHLFETTSRWPSESLALHEVLLVDDGSSDSSGALALEASAAWAQKAGRPNLLKVIRHPHQLGYGAALKTGIAAASGDIVCFYDIDGTYNPDSIPALILAMNQHQAAMACGDRLSQCQHMPMSRQIGNKLFVATINLLFRARVADSCTGMRVFKKSLISFFSSPHLPDSLDYSLAMTLAFLQTGSRLVEVPIPYAGRIGQSKLRIFSDGPRFFARILSSWAHTPKYVKALNHNQKMV